MCRRVYACATPESDERLVWIIRGVTGWGVPEPGVLCIGRHGPWFPSQCLGSRRTVSSLQAAGSSQERSPCGVKYVSHEPIVS